MKGDKSSRMDRMRLRTKAAPSASRSKADSSSGGLSSTVGKFGPLAAIAASGAAILAKRRSAKSTQQVQTIDYPPVQNTGTVSQPAVETTPPVVESTTGDTPHP